MTTRREGFFDAVAGVWRQARRIERPDEEVLQEFRRVTESVTLTDGTPSIEDKTAGTYKWKVAADADRILWGEWVWRT